MKITLSKEGSRKCEYFDGLVTICWTKFVITVVFFLIAIGLTIWAANSWGYLRETGYVATLFLIWKTLLPNVITTNGK